MRNHINVKFQIQKNNDIKSSHYKINGIQRKIAICKLKWGYHKTPRSLLNPIRLGGLNQPIRLGGQFDSPPKISAMGSKITWMMIGY